MKNVFFGLIFGLLVSKYAYGVEDLSRFEKECLAFIKAPQVEATSSYGKLKYNFDKDAKYLYKETAKKFQANNQEIPEGFAPIGLTKVQDGFRFNMEIGQMNVSQGYICLFPTKIKAHLGYYSPTIYVLKTLKKDSCFYEVSLRHEKTHMQIYIEGLDYFLPTFKNEVNSLFGSLGVRVVKKDGNLKAEAEKLNNLYLEKLRKKVDVWRRVVEKEQLKLDSPEHYYIENQICREVFNE